MLMTADFHQRYGDGSIRSAMKLTLDPHAPADQWEAEHPEWAPDPTANACYTIGYLTATIGSLLNVLGYPEHGPNVDQHSWLPELDEGDE